MIRFPAVFRICEDIPDGGICMPDGGTKITDGGVSLPDGGSEKIEFRKDLHLSYQFSVEIYSGGGTFHTGRGASSTGRGGTPSRRGCFLIRFCPRSPPCSPRYSIPDGGAFMPSGGRLVSGLFFRSSRPFCWASFSDSLA